MANGEDVGEVGTRVLGLHGDPGKPSTADRRSDAGCPSERTEVAKAQGAVGVGEVKEPSRSRQGGREGVVVVTPGETRDERRSPRSAKGNAEKASELTPRRQGPARSGTSSILYGRPPRGGEGGERPSGAPSVLGERGP